MSARIARLLLVIAMAAGAHLLAPGPAEAMPRPDHASDGLVLDGVDVALRSGTQQVVTVNHTTGHHARIGFWKLTDAGWVERLSTDDGRIGYGGLVAGPDREQGSGTTPLGSYLLTYAFGTQQPRDAWGLRYRQIQRGDFWVQDNASSYYNRYRNQREGGFRWWLPSSDPNGSERLSDFRREYELSIVVDFNRAQVRHRGAGIFLHVNGSGPTAGCVSAPRRFVQRLMAALDPDLVPVVAVGR